MDKKIIKTEFNSMYHLITDLFICPNCFKDTLENKWTTETYVRYTCVSCKTHVFIVSKEYKEEDEV